MDHFSASLFEYSDTAKGIRTITSEFDDFENKEPHLQLKYYKEISDAIAVYEKVMLFGPTTAKNELQAILSHDNRFAAIEVTIKITDKLTHTEQVDYINNCFYITP